MTCREVVAAARGGWGYGRHLFRGRALWHGGALLGGAEAQLELQDQAAHVGVERIHLPSR